MKQDVKSGPIDEIQFVLLRRLRDLRDTLLYPVWLLRGKPAPDNHIYKRKRILKIKSLFSCQTFIETGTFYGQTINAMKSYFDKTLSIELFQRLYELNTVTFRKYPHVKIFYGDSSVELKNMLKEANGRILFWLDGHYSGRGTACGETTSPIIAELKLIMQDLRRDHCILIDDARLFNGEDGYPTVDQVKKILIEINPHYTITLDNDCIVAVLQH